MENTVRKVVGLYVTKSENKNSNFYSTIYGKLLYNPEGGVPKDEDFEELCDIHMTFGSHEIKNGEKFIDTFKIHTFDENTHPTINFERYVDKIVASTDESLGLPGFDCLLDLRHFADWFDATGVSCEFTYVKKCVKCKSVMENHICVCGEDSNYFYSFKVHTVDNKVKLLGSL